MSGAQFGIGHGRRGGKLSHNARVRRIAPPGADTVGQIIRARGDEYGQRVGTLYVQRALGGADTAAGAYHLNLGFVLQAVVQLAAGREPAARAQNRRAVGVGKSDGTGISAAFVGREAKHHHLLGGAGKILAAPGSAVRGVIDGMNGSVDIQAPAVALRSAVRQVEKEIAQVLIAAGIFLVARPQGYLIELEMLAACVAEDHRAEAAVADRKRLALPVFGGLLIPQSQPLACRRGPEQERADKRTSDSSHDHSLFCTLLGRQSAGRRGC